ncbi:MAG: LysR family transcriptional regulator [Ramlibacter sp.]|jgi:DNA-binding transcriptional LysR family regulator|uniref:LysR family transcriptional regulator n=1 Tax=Ramlibacter sp. TaxID=1917967 RepID=UPI0026235CDB|nr:LysR family transcriptional regulator [Ramlibacter sp.]MDB5751034.1 LysR family transcriptional regulator [Ramlibacter sp.]
MNQDKVSALTLKQLRAFVAVYRLRRLTTAAAQLYVTQSAVSALIRQLEEGLGVRMFDRTTRSLQPTAAAHDVIEIAQRVLRDIDSLSAGLDDLSVLRRGRVTVACTPTLAEILLPPVIREFRQLHPEIQVNVDDCAPDQFIARLIGEHADFGIGTPDRADDGVQMERLISDHLSVVCRADDPMALRKSVRWKDLDGVPVTTVRPGFGVRPLIDHSAARAGIRLNVAREVSLLSTALWMTSCGMGPSLMPAAYVRYSRDPDLLARALTAPRVSRDIYVLVKQGRSLSPAAQQLVQVLHAHMKALPAATGGLSQVGLRKG